MLSYYKMDVKVPRKGELKWIGLHQIDSQRQGAAPFDPMVLLASRIEGGERVPVKTMTCHGAFKFEELELTHGDYEIVVFHCNRRIDATKDNHTATITLHGKGPKFVVSADVSHDTKYLKRCLVDFARSFGEIKKNRQLTTYEFNASKLTIWVAENVLTSSSKKYFAKIEASLKHRNKVFASFVDNPDSINCKLVPGEVALLTVAVTDKTFEPSSLSRTKQVSWERVSYKNTVFYE